MGAGLGTALLADVEQGMQDGASTCLLLFLLPVSHSSPDHVGPVATAGTGRTRVGHTCADWLANLCRQLGCRSPAPARNDGRGAIRRRP